MKTVIVENTWLNGMEHGWGNGYVIIPNGHPAHGKHYDDIDVDVHGGLTFSSSVAELSKWKEFETEDKDAWVVGFDTAHWNDTQSKWTKEEVQKETDELAAQIEKIT